MSSSPQDSTNNSDQANVNHREPVADHAIIQRETQSNETTASVEEAIIASTPIYVAGKLRVEFANKGLEKECEAAAQELSAVTNQSVSPHDYGTIFGYEAGKESNHSAYLSRKTRPYRYLAENAKWVLSVDEQDTYVIEPHSVVELNEFIHFLKQSEQAGSSSHTLCVIVGEQLGYTESGNEEASVLPKVRCKHMFAFNADAQAIESKLGEAGLNTTTKAINDLLRLLNVKQNSGNSDLERAKNFLAFRYPDIYAVRASEAAIHLDTKLNAYQEDKEQEFLRSIDTRIAQSAPGHTLVDVIFHYQRSVSGRQFSYYATVDVSQLFPYLHSPLSDYIPHN
ncbi:hypothetical protein Vca1114GL_03508 [Vibrio campbellii]|uniref:cyanobactin maturation protease PatG family protein n=1 Tax=Vibrio campbellii TaxID=680 RepID=UPI00097FA77D|nr:hypothetical protein [Vibrio campbellii]AQM69934.1 hypothetical protein Vca1114GL_03508 [Vibrio campbellii]